MSWNIWRNEEQVHTFPVADIRDHTMDTNCICNPKVEHINPKTLKKYKKTLVVHNSFDGREYFE